MNKIWKFVSIFLVLSMLLTSCASASDWTRRDMPTDGLSRVVTYNLQGPAGTDQEKNQAMLRGVNEIAPTFMQGTNFDRMSGSKTQDVQVILPDGTVYQALGMVKTERFAGLSNFLSLEIATYSAIDYSGNAVCGAKIRLQFNRNFVQYADINKRDWDSLWYYDIPCQKDGSEFRMSLESAKLRAVVLNEVWQARIFAGSFFVNWGHSVTAVDGPAVFLSPAWWLHWDLPGTDNDTMGAAKIVNAMVLDLESSEMPWLEFKQGGSFDSLGGYLIYSAGDADVYWSWDRVLLNRQVEYAVFYRPNRETSWDYIMVRPIYNYEFNDVQQVLAGLRGWNALDPMHNRLTKEGLPKDMSDSAIKELERIGWMNAPNASLEQIQYLDSSGQVIYAMTVRAFIGASDTLVMFGPASPPSLVTIRQDMPAGEALPMPLVYNDKGKPLPDLYQPYTTKQWAEWSRESTMWNFIHDNPGHVNAELEVQFRFDDNSIWEKVYCSDSNGNQYVCSYRPVEWNLATSYYFDDGDVKKAWLISQLLGEVGVRTLGMSYASGLYAGTGMLFAMSQVVHREEFFSGYQPESIWTFDARASQLPDRLSDAWAALGK
ncbi:MAG: hypothetical protein ABII80_02715 [bacterium]